MRGLCNEKAPFGAWTDHAGLSGPLSGAEAVPSLLHGAYLLARSLPVVITSRIASPAPSRRLKDLTHTLESERDA